MSVKRAAKIKRNERERDNKREEKKEPLAPSDSFGALGSSLTF
jgi:hypothetical protein